MLLPLFVLIERHHRAPMLDLSIFENRLFSAATAAAFINGLSRFALLFLFVFYFQGVKGDDPIKAGIELAPMAIGMLIASPLAGVWADRHGSRTLAAWGMVVGAVALAGMTTLGVDTPYFWSALWLFVVGVGSGMFNSPNTAAMMGTVPPNRRGIAAGARTMLQNTGAVISIAFVLAVVTSSVDKDTLFKIFSGVTTGLSDATLDPFVSNMHPALWVLARDVVGGRARLACCGRRGMSDADRRAGARRRGRRCGPSATTRRSGCCRSGERVGGRAPRVRRRRTSSGCASCVRLKALLGLSLDELREVMAGEDGARERRREWHETTDPASAAAAGARRAPTRTRCWSSCGGARRSSRRSRPN